MFTRIAAGLLLCALAAPAVAQQIYKCVTKAGTEYQSAPCANGEAAKTWAVEVAPRSEGVIENERRLDAIRQQNSASIAPDLHQRSLSIGTAVVAHASTTFLSTGTRKHAKPPRPSESVFSACTVLTGLTWSAAAWMTWFGRPASRPLAYITGLARSYPEDK